MSTHPRLSIPRGALLAVLALFVLAGGAFAESGYTGIWQSQYPGSTSDNNVISGTGTSCQLCHRDVFGGNNYNSYGFRMRQFMDAGQSPLNAIISSESFDSDDDPTGTTNGDEIAANTQPGWTDGPNNTTYSGSNPTQNQLPPANINGDLDPPVGSWTDLGNALAGTAGTPVFTGSGPLTAGSTAVFALSNALPGGSSFLVLGLTQLNAPFKGGVLVPDADIILAGLPINGSGDLVFGLTWPAGLPSGFSLYWQHWIPDAGGPVGFSASNGLQSTTP